MKIIGIDPGKSGAVAVIDASDVRFFDTPVGDLGGKRRYLCAQMADFLRDHAKDAVAALEHVQAMPSFGDRDESGKAIRRSMGAASAFEFGRGLGIWEGILSGLGIPYDLVTPRRWKAVMLDGMGKEKDAARLRAMQMFPGVAYQLARKKDHGRAEALLLAEYRRRVGAGQPAKETA